MKGRIPWTYPVIYDDEVVGDIVDVDKLLELDAKGKRTELSKDMISSELREVGCINWIIKELLDIKSSVERELKSKPLSEKLRELQRGRRKMNSWKHW